MNDNDNDAVEARQIAGSTIRTFNAVSSALTKKQQITATRELLAQTAALLQKLERQQS